MKSVLNGVQEFTPEESLEDSQDQRDPEETDPRENPRAFAAKFKERFLTRR